MKRIVALALLVSVTLFTISSCKKDDTTITPKPTATIIFNDSITVEADSVYWDYYSTNLPRVRFIKNNIAVVTLWPGSVASSTHDLTTQYLYWIINEPTVYTVNSSGGTVTINNNSNVLSGTLSATGDVWTGTGPAPTTVRATFSNVSQKTN